ncbi:putative peptide chain release factor [Gracilariopsis chorda]|uniref:Putative peptide chain release factor n=1 Tax=Gracilariopsis chorda TaxID=448386 RepID=A0A2V3J1R0_9FLOR|nr:putative peptide chain release factor [Gracilariopsis chorda]|eukprot:PXF47907.1 putative peptide chain release factor [Gracilariopsis chorda]
MASQTGGEEQPKLKLYTSTEAENGLPVIREEDLIEDFVRGSGSGGQKVNKTSNCVMLKHIPSGIIVKCQQTRSREQNRRLAREILQRRLDEQIRGEESLAAKELHLARARKAKRRRKSIKKHFKSRRDRSLSLDF